MAGFLLKIVIHIVCLLPESVAYALGSFIGWGFGSVFRYHRQDALDALKRSFPEWTESDRVACVNRMYRNLGCNAVETMRLYNASREKLLKQTEISEENQKRLTSALERGKGLLVLTGHIGNWEFLPPVSFHTGVMASVIVKNIRNVSVNEVIREIRCKSGGDVLPPRNVYRQCLKRLKKNEIIAFILDQNMIDTEGEFVEFFGRPACTSLGLAHCSASSGAPVIPVFVIRKSRGTYELQVGDLMEPPKDRERETLIQETQRYTTVLENVISRYPDQWIWIHRRWRTTPQQESQDENPE